MKNSTVAAIATGSLVLGSLAGAQPLAADSQLAFNQIGTGADVRECLAHASNDLCNDAHLIARGNHYIAMEGACGEGTCGATPAKPAPKKGAPKKAASKTGAEGACGEGTCGSEVPQPDAPKGMKTEGNGSKSNSGMRRSRATQPTQDQQARMLRSSGLSQVGENPVENGGEVPQPTTTREDRRQERQARRSHADRDGSEETSMRSRRAKHVSVNDKEDEDCGCRGKSARQGSPFGR